MASHAPRLRYTLAHIVNDAPNRTDDSLLDDLTEQLERTRRLLTGSPAAAAEQALARIGGDAAFEARIAVELAEGAPLAQPARFLEAHRLVMRALELLDREGDRTSRSSRLGPLSRPADMLIELVAGYITSRYAASVMSRLRTLYGRREAQCPPEAPERRMLARARVDADRLAPGYGGGVRLPTLLVGGATLGWLSQMVSTIEFGNLVVQLALVGVLFVLFFALSWVLLRGAAVAHHSSRLIMRRPLAALWETIGHCGNPPRDNSQTFATVAIALTALAWFVLPAVAAALFFL